MWIKKRCVCGHSMSTLFIFCYRCIFYMIELAIPWNFRGELIINIVINLDTKDTITPRNS